MIFSNKGYTLIELITSISIVGILLIAAAPKLNADIDQAKLARAEVEVSYMKQIIDLYRISNSSGEYPAISGPNSIIEVMRDNGYTWYNSLNGGMLDPWGGKYRYTTDGNHYIVGDDYVSAGDNQGIHKGAAPNNPGMTIESAK